MDLGYAAERPARPDLVVSSSGEAADVILGMIESETPKVNYEQLKIKLFADGADLDQMMRCLAIPNVKGFTTNPTLMRKAGITDYKAFARKVSTPFRIGRFVRGIRRRLRRHGGPGREIASWGANVNVKIPVTNTKGEFAAQ